MEIINGSEYWERGDFSLLIRGLSPEDSAKRHDIRYGLFRCQTEFDGGNKAEPEHHKIMREVLVIEGAGHIMDFAKTWDVGEVSPDILVVNRLWSIHQEHNQLMHRISVPITKNDTPETLAKKEQAAKDREKKYKKAELKKAEEQKKRGDKGDV